MYRVTAGSHQMPQSEAIYSARNRPITNRVVCAMSPSAMVSPLLHEPAVTHHDRLAGQRIRIEAGKHHGAFRNIGNGGEFTVHRFLTHDLLYDVGFAYAQFLRLLRNLLVYQRRAHE